jgi:hypothetical protein
MIPVENTSPNQILIKEIIERIIKGDRSFFSLQFMEENYITLNEPFPTQYLWLDDNSNRQLIGEEKLLSWFQKNGVDELKRYVNDIVTCTFMEYAVWLKRFHIVSSFILAGINPCCYRRPFQNEMQPHDDMKLRDVAIAVQQRFCSGVVPLSLSSYMVQRVVTLRRSAWERYMEDDAQNRSNCIICNSQIPPQYQLNIEERCNADTCQHHFCEVCLWNDLLDNMYHRNEDVVVCPVCYRNQSRTLDHIIDCEVIRAKRREKALDKFLKLPADSKAIKMLERKKNVVAERESLSSSWSKAVKPSLGMTQTSRRDKFFMYVDKNDSVAFVKGCIDEGIDVLMQNEYGQTALFIAVWRRDAQLVRLLLNYGSDPDITANGRISCLSIAKSKGMREIESLLKQAGAKKTTIHNFWTDDDRQLACINFDLALQRNILIPCDSDHPGAGSFVVNGCFKDKFIENLVELWRSLPVAQDREKKAEPCSIRSYFCDVDDWITINLRHVIGAASGSETLEGHRYISVLPRMRFLCYEECGAELSPHVDLCRIDTASNHRSTHTFLFYLTSCINGGETALLNDVAGEGRNIIRALVKPNRGRLLVFPHRCPHEGLAVQDVPKLLIRGEVVAIDDLF